MKRVLLAIILTSVILAGALPSLVSSYFISPHKSNEALVTVANPQSWSIHTRGQIRGNPILCDLDNDDEIELVFSDDRDGLQVVAASTGQPHWQQNLIWDSTFQPFVSDMNGDTMLDVIAASYGEIVVLSGADGTVIWHRDYQNGWDGEEIALVSNLANESTPEIIARNNEGNLVIMNGQNGNIDWETGNFTEHSPIPVAAGDSRNHIAVVEHFQGNTKLALYNGSGGNIIWDLPQYEEIRRQPIVVDLDGNSREEILFGNDYPIGERIVVADALNGTVVWEFQSEQALTSGNMWANDLDLDGTLEVIVDTEYTHVINGQTGEEIWAYEGSGYSRTVAIGNLAGSPEKELFIMDLGVLWAFNPLANNQIWLKELADGYNAYLTDFDNDDYDEVLSLHYTGGYVLEGDTGQILWYDQSLFTIQTILFMQESDASSKFAILVSNYRIRSMEITGFNPDTEALLTLGRYLPLYFTITFVSITLIVTVGKRRNLKAFNKIRMPQRAEGLWERLLQIDPTIFRFKAAFWTIILLTPFVWMTTPYSSSLVVIIAPLWYQISITEGPPTPTFGISGIPPSQIFTQLMYIIPLVLPAILLELNSRRYFRSRFPRRFIWLIPIVIAGVGLWFWTSGTPVVILPLPFSIIMMVITDSIVRRQVPDIKEGTAVPEAATYMQAVRGGEFVGNRFRFKVKVINNSNEMVTDVKVAILSYPEESLQLESEPTKSLAKLEPQGFRSPTFEFLPTTDCVKGSIIATVSFVDFTGTAHSKTTEPFIIRAVCDLLRPQKVTPAEFVEKLKALEQNEMVFKVDDWTPEEMHSKALQTLESANFHEVESILNDMGNHVQSRITGWAQGVYTEKSIGVEVMVSGKPGKKGATCTIRVAGEDVAMILPAIDEIAQKIQAWLCPVCTAKLPEEVVTELKKGKTTTCPFCGVSMNR